MTTQPVSARLTGVATATAHMKKSFKIPLSTPCIRSLLGL